MKVMVTGGCGFIGSHIVDLLCDAGHTVAVVDNLSTGSLDNLNKNARFYEADIRSDAFREAVRDFSPEVIYHEAAQIDIQKSIRESSFDAEVNVVGTVKVLEAVRDFGVKKLIYASSAAVYGNPEYLPVDENHPKAPMSFYGISKYTPEFYIRTFSALYGFTFTILRYANVFGVRQDPKGEGGVVSIFTDKLLRGETPVIFGDGEQTRDFVYVGDIAGANLAALTAGDGEVINVSTCKSTTVNELVHLMTDGKVKPEYRDARAGDILHSYLDNSKLKNILGYTPRYSLKEGLDLTMEYYRKKFSE
ncbi:MAG: SDR family oxidoreductase [Oscillospiraceae bacterium]|nr:SDR family oxidoreductase [Oscillospiraceae bacterium]